MIQIKPKALAIVHFEQLIVNVLIWY